MTVGIEVRSLADRVLPETRRTLPVGALAEPDALRQAATTQEQAFQVARHFESLLIEEVVKSARSAGGGWLGDEADATSESVAEMGEQFLARALAAGGGFGLAARFTPLIARDLQAADSLPASKS